MLDNRRRSTRDTQDCWSVINDISVQRIERLVHFGSPPRTILLPKKMRINNRDATPDDLMYLAKTNRSILLVGDTGTGKEELSDYIQSQSLRAGKPYDKINCSTITNEHLRSELFGHEMGSYTGSISARKGMIRNAKGGTIFLDEIGKMDLQSQGALLRLLQNREAKALGSDKTYSTNVRILAATNADIYNDKSFLQDLRHRFDCEIRIPALKERISDLFRLLYLFTSDYGENSFTGVTLQTLGVLVSHDWPGNIRELRKYCNDRISFQRTSNQFILHDCIGPSDDNRDPLYKFAPFALSVMEEEYKKEKEHEEIPFYPESVNALKLLGVFYQLHHIRRGKLRRYMHPHVFSIKELAEMSEDQREESWRYDFGQLSTALQARSLYPRDVLTKLDIVSPGGITDGLTTAHGLAREFSSMYSRKELHWPGAKFMSLLANWSNELPKYMQPVPPLQKEHSPDDILKGRDLDDTARKIAQLKIAGNNNKEIAKITGRSSATVRRILAHLRIVCPELKNSLLGKRGRPRKKKLGRK